MLRFSPTAWAKLLYLRDFGETEVGGFGITDADDLLFVREFVLVEQLCTELTVSFVDEAVADFFDRQVDLGRQPEQFARVWVHTHPGYDPRPSFTDEETFERVFGDCDWAVMAIVARGGDSFARLHWQQGQVSLPLEMSVDYSQPFGGTAIDEWETEYLANVWDEATCWGTVSTDQPEEGVGMWDRALTFETLGLEAS